MALLPLLAFEEVHQRTERLGVVRFVIRWHIGDQALGHRKPSDEFLADLGRERSSDESNTLTAFALALDRG